MMTYDDVSKKISLHIQKDFIAFLKAFEILSKCSKFQVNKEQFSIYKKYNGDNFIPTSHKGLRGQNTSLRIELVIKLTEPSGTLHYK